MGISFAPPSSKHLIHDPSGTEYRQSNCCLPVRRYLGRHGRGLHADVVHFQIVCCVPAPADLGGGNSSGSRCNGKMEQAETGRGRGEVGNLRGSRVACSVQANGAPLYVPDFLLPRRPRRTRRCIPLVSDKERASLLT